MKNSKKVVVKIAEKSLVTVAEIFASLGCNCRSYEPKMPKKLQK